MIRYLFLLFLLLVPKVSLARFAIEPYLGVSLVYNQTTQSALHFILPTIGARLGFNQWGIMMGIDGSYNNLLPFSSFESVNTACDAIGVQFAPVGFQSVLAPINNAICSNKNVDYQSYHIIQLGPSVSVSLPFIIDVYGSVFFTIALNNSTSLNGAGFKIGASYLSLPLLSMNLEFQSNFYFSCVDRKSKEACLEDNNHPRNLFIGMFNISMPISFQF